MISVLHKAIEPPGDEHKFVKAQLRRRLSRLSFHALELCVRHLLRILGYQDVRVLGRKTLKGRTSSGGFDITARSPAAISPGLVLVQVKQYTRPVDRRFIDELRGAMLRLGAPNGVVITTGTFSVRIRQAAVSYAGRPVRLVDGNELAELMFRHRIGVLPRVTKDRFIEWVTDDVFFEALERRSLYGYDDSNSAGSVSSADTLTGEPPRSSRVHRKGGAITWRTHLAAGIASLWILEAIPGAISEGAFSAALSTNVGFLSLAAVLGALLPDLDAARSKIKFAGVGGIRPLIPLSELIHTAWGHRGPLHSLLGLCVVALIASPVATQAGWQTFAALLLGYASHLALDACTRSGVQFLYPNRTRYHLLPRGWRFFTGTPAEACLFILLALFAAALLLRTLI